jgi:hypothetical protein
MTELLLAGILAAILYPRVKPWLRTKLIRWRNR